MPDRGLRGGDVLRHILLDVASDENVRHVVDVALEEDAARDDVTTNALVPSGQRGAAVLVAKEPGVIAGLSVAKAAFATLDPTVRFDPAVEDGATVPAGAELARIEGPLAPILSAERVALNLLQRLSGIATATRALVDAVGALPVRILDTRKTTPGLRALERYAVAVGGGTNHRFDLSSSVLIKDNHLAAARSRGATIADVVREARAAAPAGMSLEVEAATVDDAREAVAAGADIVLLDNMTPDDMRAVARETDGRALLEASGGITVDNVRAVAETGVDAISVGAITHSPRALDISLELELSAD